MTLPAEEVLRRESGSTPARLEPRLLCVLRKAGHLRMATLRNCLSQEIEADRFVSALTDDILRLMIANSPGETANALDALEQYS